MTASNCVPTLDSNYYLYLLNNSFLSEFVFPPMEIFCIKLFPSGPLIAGEIWGDRNTLGLSEDFPQRTVNIAVS